LLCGVSRNYIKAEELKIVLSGSLWYVKLSFKSCLFASVVGNRLLGKKPFFLSHLVTSRCNCGCPVCLWRDRAGEELDTGEIEKLYREAKETVFTANVIWGGEPLFFYEFLTNERSWVRS